MEPGKSCRQTLEGVAEFRVPVLGRLVELVVADSLKRVYSGIPPIAKKCARLIRLARVQGHGQDTVPWPCAASHRTSLNPRTSSPNPPKLLQANCLSASLVSLLLSCALA